RRLIHRRLRALRVDDRPTSDRRTVVLEYHPEPSRRCDLELMRDDWDREPHVWDLAVPMPGGWRRLLALGRAAVAGPVGPVAPVARVRAIRAVLAMTSGRARALVARPAVLRDLHAGPPGRILCYSATNLPLVDLLADLSGAEVRTMLARGTQYLGEFAFEM